MEMPRDLPYSEVRDLLQAIIQKREERNEHKGEEYRKKDAELDALLEILAQQFMRSPPKGMMIMEARPLPPAEEDDEFYPSSESHFDPVQEFRRAVPDSKNETPANLDTTPRKKEETPEQIRQQELLEKLFEGGKISAYSMKQSLYTSLKKAPSTLYRSISSVSKKVIKPFKKGMKSMKTKKYKKYRKY